MASQTGVGMGEDFLILRSTVGEQLLYNLQDNWAMILLVRSIPGQELVFLLYK